MGSQDRGAGRARGGAPRRRAVAARTRGSAPQAQANPAVRLARESLGPALEPRPAAETVLDVLARAGIVFFRWDVSRGLTYINAEAPGLLGYTREELMGDPEVSQRIVDPEFLPQLEKSAPEAFVAHEGAFRYGKIPFRSKRGERVWFEARVVPDMSGDGRIHGFFGVAFVPPER